MGFGSSTNSTKKVYSLRIHYVYLLRVVNSGIFLLLFGILEIGRFDQKRFFVRFFIMQKQLYLPNSFFVSIALYKYVGIIIGLH